MKLVWTRSAIDDLDDLHEYIRKERPAAARRVAREILESVERLVAAPESGRKSRIHGVREVLVGKYPYVIPYRIHGDEIQLLRVLHTRQSFPDELG
jgi:toxin ParE1/3/4